MGGTDGHDGVEKRYDTFTSLRVYKFTYSFIVDPAAHRCINCMLGVLRSMIYKVGLGVFEQLAVSRWPFLSRHESEELVARFNN